MSLFNWFVSPDKNILKRLESLMASVDELKAKIADQKAAIDGVLDKVTGLGQLVISETEQQRASNEKQSALIAELKAQVANLQITDLSPLVQELESNNLQLQEAFSKIGAIGTQLSAIVPDEVTEIIPVVAPVESDEVTE